MSIVQFHSAEDLQTFLVHLQSVIKPTAWNPGKNQVEFFTKKSFLNSLPWAWLSNST